MDAGKRFACSLYNPVEPLAWSIGHLTDGCKTLYFCGTYQFDEGRKAQHRDRQSSVDS